MVDARAFFPLLAGTKFKYYHLVIYCLDLPFGKFKRLDVHEVKAVASKER